MQLELQIADLLSVANCQLVCAKIILVYPKNFNKNYDPTVTIDQFWMNTCKTYFYESLLLTSTLLSKDKRTISFYNWTDFRARNKSWLDMQSCNFNDTGLKEVRDQMVGHVDISNDNNRLPRHRRQGVINEILVIRLDKILQFLISKFDEFTRLYSRPYNYNSFFSGEKAKKEVEAAISQAKPQLTSNLVI